MWAIANHIEIPREHSDRTKIDSQTNDTFNPQDPEWDSVRLTNTTVQQMVRDIEGTGLGTLEESYMSIVPPLSIAEKLPSEAIVDFVRSKVRDHEQCRRWEEASRAYIEHIKICESMS